MTANPVYYDYFIDKFAHSLFEKRCAFTVWSRRLMLQSEADGHSTLDTGISYINHSEIYNPSRHAHTHATHDMHTCTGIHCTSV